MNIAYNNDLKRIWIDLLRKWKYLGLNNGEKIL